MPQPPRSLLLIEDDETTLAVLTLLLEGDGWLVTGAGSGEEALTHLRSGVEKPAIILSDQNLPGIEGPALATALRAIYQPEHLIAMSATPSAGVPQGYDALLQKPFGPPQLHDVLARLANPAVNTAATTARAVLATTTREQLSRQMGKAAADLYRFALQDAEARLQRMETAIPAADHDLFHREAHALKGSAGMIGAEELAALAARAESSNADTTDVQRHQTVQEMHLACDAIRRMLEALYPA